jgi:hypothetical protein
MVVDLVTEKSLRESVEKELQVSLKNLQAELSNIKDTLAVKEKVGLYKNLPIRHKESKRKTI